MGRDERKALIKEIEDARGSNVVVYFTADRQPIGGARIAEDAVRPLYRHLRALMQEKPRLDLFVYSRGGDVSVPWRIVTMMREFCEEFSVLIPYKAYSAATMISLGADHIVMGKKAELGPIDPTLTRVAAAEGGMPPPEISVEDVSSYISFMKERANITDQSALAQVISQLATNLTPLTLGSVNRQYSHIRLVARKILTSRAEKVEESKISAIIEALTEKMYSHGHAIGRKEAQELGLPVDKPDEALESAIWRLYEEYERLLRLDEPLDPEEVLLRVNADEYTEQAIPIAVIESQEKLHQFETNYAFRRRRQIPPNPQLNLTLNLGLPAGTDPARLPAEVQEVIQRMLAQISPQIQRLVQAEIARQSPVTGIELRSYGGKWVER